MNEVLNWARDEEDTRGREAWLENGQSGSLRNGFKKRPVLPPLWPASCCISYPFYT